MRGKKRNNRIKNNFNVDSHINTGGKYNVSNLSTKIVLSFLHYDNFFTLVLLPCSIHLKTVIATITKTLNLKDIFPEKHNFQ